MYFVSNRLISPHSSSFYISTLLMKATTFLLYTHLLLAISLIICIPSLYLATSKDPGYIRRSSDGEERKRVVIDLAEQGSLDKRHYCLSCNVSKERRDRERKYEREGERESHFNTSTILKGFSSHSIKTLSYMRSLRC